MSVQEREPILPVGYELAARAHSASVLEEACALAAGGAPEGTLVWARSQDDCDLGAQRRWRSGTGNLHLAIVFRPDADTPPGLAQLTLVASVALGAAVAEHAPPWMALRYRWPNDVLVNEGRFGAAHYRCERPDSPSWAVLAVNANVATSPEDPALEASNLAESGCEIDAVEMLESFARHLLTWLDRWANDGADPVLRAWRARAEDTGAPAAFSLGTRRIEGVFRGVDDAGAAVVEAADGSTHRLGLDEYLRDGHRLDRSVASPPA